MTEDKIKEVLSKIKEPELNVDFVKLGFVNSISLNGNDLKLTLGISELPENILNETKEHIKKEFKTSNITISAQEYLKKFYETHNFKQTSEMYLEDDIPHIEMKRK